MAPTEAEEILPYSVVNCLAFSPTYCNMARRSFKSSNSMPLSSAILNTRFNTPSCVSFKPSKRPSNKGPMSEMVARTGWPCSPNTSHKVTGLPANSGTGMPVIFRRSSNFGEVFPGWEIPVKSPFTSAMNTGVPIREKASANTCKVTVLPVPVAPVIKPCRFAN